MARRSKTQWKELIAEQALNGFSAAEFCRHKSINPKYSGLLAYIAVSKYADSLPRYRQNAILSRCGIDINRSTLANWMIKCGELIQPLINCFEEQVLSQSFIHMDDLGTPLWGKRRCKCSMRRGNQRNLNLICGFGMPDHQTNESRCLITTQVEVARYPGDYSLAMPAR